LSIDIARRILEAIKKYRAASDADSGDEETPPPMNWPTPPTLTWWTSPAGMLRWQSSSTSTSRNLTPRHRLQEH
jgi:hypothetical protein